MKSKTIHLETSGDNEESLLTEVQCLILDLKRRSARLKEEYPREYEEDKANFRIIVQVEQKG